MRVKICGITRADQAQAIAHLGATDLGFICVPSSLRYLKAQAIQAIIATLPMPSPNRIGVFANAKASVIQEVMAIAKLTGIQLHGHESPEFCQHLKACFPNVELIKAFRIQTSDQLVTCKDYTSTVDAFLLDAYHSQQLGGTGQTLDWQDLKGFQPDRPWFLAGGLNPENVQQALSMLQPDGIDLSSGVEQTPGYKDLEKVKRLFEMLDALITV